MGRCEWQSVRVADAYGLIDQRFDSAGPLRPDQHRGAPTEEIGGESLARLTSPEAGDRAHTGNEVPPFEPARLLAGHPERNGRGTLRAFAVGIAASDWMPLRLPLLPPRLFGRCCQQCLALGVTWTAPSGY